MIILYVGNVVVKYLLLLHYVDIFLVNKQKIKIFNNIKWVTNSLMPNMNHRVGR